MSGDSFVSCALGDINAAEGFEKKKKVRTMSELKSSKMLYFL